MIRSFASELAEELYEGRWSGLARQAGEELLEECFIDLRLIEIARLENDLMCAFLGRISVVATDSTNLFAVTSPGRCRPASYRIEFELVGGHIERLNVIMVPKQERR